MLLSLTKKQCYFINYALDILASNYSGADNEEEIVKEIDELTEKITKARIKDKFNSAKQKQIKINKKMLKSV